MPWPQTHLWTIITIWTLGPLPKMNTSLLSQPAPTGRLRPFSWHRKGASLPHPITGGGFGLQSLMMLEPVTKNSLASRWEASELKIEWVNVRVWVTTALVAVQPNRLSLVLVSKGPSRPLRTVGQVVCPRGTCKALELAWRSKLGGPPLSHQLGQRVCQGRQARRARLPRYSLSIGPSAEQWHMWSLSSF